MKKKYNPLPLSFVCVGIAAMVCVKALPALASTGDPFASVPTLLGRAYVDIRYGFSVRPPYGAEFSRVPTVPETLARQQSPASMEESDLLRLPESKELVRFHKASTQTTLTVSWMVARDRNFDLEKMHAIREQYWRRFPSQATLEPNSLGPSHDLPSSSVMVHWKRAPSDSAGLLIQETILQCEPSRFFVLSLTQPVQDASQRKTAEKLSSALVRNFEYFNLAQQNHRRGKARLNSQKWLESLDFHSIKHTLVPQYGYRIRYHNKDIGFMWIREQLGTLDEKTVIQIHCDSFIASESMAEPFLRWRGYGNGLTHPNRPTPCSWKSIRILEEYQLLGDFQSEHFLVTIFGPNHPKTRYREQGHWQAENITILRFDDSSKEQNQFSETLKVNDRLYLPGGLGFLLHRIPAPNAAEEYLFLCYANQVLRFYSLRTVGHETIEVVPAGPEEPPSDAKEVSEQKTSISTTYVVGRVGLDGTIVEAWIDKTGYTVQLRTDDGLVLIRSPLETLTKLWPQQIQSLEPKPE